MLKKIRRKIESIGFKNSLFFIVRRFFDVIIRSDNLYFKCDLSINDSPDRLKNKDIKIIEKLSFSDITESERKSFLELGTATVLSVFEKKLAEGDRLFIAYINNEMAGLCWVNFGGNRKFYSIPLSDSIPLSENEFMLMSGYTIDRYRQRGVGTALVIEILSKLKKEGYRWGYAVTNTWNISQKVLLKMGFIIVGRFRELRLLRRNILIWTAVNKKDLD